MGVGVSYERGTPALATEGTSHEQVRMVKAKWDAVWPNDSSRLAPTPVSSSSLLLSSLELSDTKVYEPQIRALLGTASHFCRQNTGFSTQSGPKTSAPGQVRMVKPKWDAVWPNDSFVKQLLEYEASLALK